MKPNELPPVMMSLHRSYLCGWVKNHYRKSIYDSSFRLQKFLFLYECFCAVRGKNVNFTYLRGYKDGPVFSEVWGAYTKEREAFDSYVDGDYKKYDCTGFDEELAEKSAFVIRTRTFNELSEYFKSMDIWHIMKEYIEKGEKQVPLGKKHFSESDMKRIRMLDAMYPIEMIKSSWVLIRKNYYFVIKKEDVPKLLPEHNDMLWEFVKSGNLVNPVFIEYDDKEKKISLVVK